MEGTGLFIILPMASPTIANYSALRKKIEEVLVLGQQKIEEAKVRTYHETGRYIHEHLLFHKDRADYGQYTLSKLAKDLGVGKRLLERILKFYRDFPSITSTRTQLSWSHYRTLSGLQDKKERLELTQRAVKEEWSSDALQLAVRNLNCDKRVEAAEGNAPSLLTVPEHGPFYTYKVIAPETTDGRLLIDLGFSCNRYLDAVTRRTFKPLDIVTSVKDSRGNYKLSTIDLKPEALYTYRAKLEKIVDGDTLRVVVDLGFDTTTRQYIRLRGIDCPEMDTKEGVIAKKFVETVLNGVESLTIKTVKPDKYDRYLGDVFVPRKDGTFLYLNNELLITRNAVKLRE